MILFQKMAYSIHHGILGKNSGVIDWFRRFLAPGIWMISKILHGYFETLLNRPVCWTPTQVFFVMSIQMPFSKERRLITKIAQRLRNRFLHQRQIQSERRSLQWSHHIDLLKTRFILGDKLESKPRRRFPCQNTGT